MVIEIKRSQAINSANMVACLDTVGRQKLMSETEHITEREREHKIIKQSAPLFFLEENFWEQKRRERETTRGKKPSRMGKSNLGL